MWTEFRGEPRSGGYAHGTPEERRLRSPATDQRWRPASEPSRRACERDEGARVGQGFRCPAQAERRIHLHMARRSAEPNGLTADWLGRSDRALMKWSVTSLEGMIVGSGAASVERDDVGALLSADLIAQGTVGVMQGGDCGGCGLELFLQERARSGLHVRVLSASFLRSLLISSFLRPLRGWSCPAS